MSNDDHPFYCHDCQRVLGDDEFGSHAHVGHVITMGAP